MSVSHGGRRCGIFGMCTMAGGTHHANLVPDMVIQSDQVIAIGVFDRV